MWAKISDDFFRHPRTVAAGRDARDLFLVSLAHCNEHLTDGFVAAGYLRRLAADAEIDNAQESARRLVEVGYWEVCDGGWIVHDFLDYNPSRTQVLADREKATARKERWKNGGRNGVPSTVPNGEGTPSPGPVPGIGERSLSPAEASAHEELPAMGRSAPAVVEATEPPLAPEPPPLELSRTDPGMRHLRDLYRAFRAERFPDQVPDQYPDSEFRKALPALRELANDCKATTAQVHKATAAAMRRYADPADGGDPMFVTVKVISGDWSAFLEDDPPPPAARAAPPSGRPDRIVPASLRPRLSKAEEIDAINERAVAAATRHGIVQPSRHSAAPPSHQPAGDRP